MKTFSEMTVNMDSTISFFESIQQELGREAIRHINLYEQSACTVGGDTIPLTDPRVASYLNLLAFQGLWIGTPDSTFTWTDIEKVYPFGFEVHGWRFQAVDKKGTGNGGKLIPVPTTKETRAIVNARTFWHVVRLTHSAGFAKRYVKAGKGLKYHQEEGVILATYRLSQALETTQQMGLPTMVMPISNRRGWWEKFTEEQIHLSHWRFDTVGEIATKLYPPEVFVMDLPETQTP